MKIRTDFVTNSSSSSFIFGKPLGVSVSKESVFNQLKIICSSMLFIIDELEMIYFKDEEYKKKVLFLRENCNDYSKISSVIDIVKKDSKNMFVYLVNKENLEFSSQECFDVFTNELDVLTQIKKFVTYKNFNEYKKEPIFYFNIVDFREQDNKDDISDIETVAYWYLDDIKSNKGIPLSTLCYNELGEVAITSESGYIPYFITHYLEKHLTYFCGHMG